MSTHIADFETLRNLYSDKASRAQNETAIKKAYSALSHERREDVIKDARKYMAEHHISDHLSKDKNAILHSVFIFQAAVKAEMENMQKLPHLDKEQAKIFNDPAYQQFVKFQNAKGHPDGIYGPLTDAINHDKACQECLTEMMKANSQREIGTEMMKVAKNAAAGIAGKATHQPHDTHPADKQHSVAAPAKAQVAAKETTVPADSTKIQNHAEVKQAGQTITTAIDAAKTDKPAKIAADSTKHTVEVHQPKPKQDSTVVKKQAEVTNKDPFAPHTEKYAFLRNSESYTHADNVLTSGNGGGFPNYTSPSNANQFQWTADAGYRVVKTNEHGKWDIRGSVQVIDTYTTDHDNATSVKKFTGFDASGSPTFIKQAGSYTGDHKVFNQTTSLTATVSADKYFRLDNEKSPMPFVGGEVGFGNTNIIINANEILYGSPTAAGTAPLGANNHRNAFTTKIGLSGGVDQTKYTPGVRVFGQTIIGSDVVTTSLGATAFKDIPIGSNGTKVQVDLGFVAHPGSVKNAGAGGPADMLKSVTKIAPGFAPLGQVELDVPLQNLPFFKKSTGPTIK